MCRKEGCETFEYCFACLALCAPDFDKGCAERVNTICECRARCGPTSVSMPTEGTLEVSIGVLAPFLGEACTVRSTVLFETRGACAPNADVDSHQHSFVADSEPFFVF